MVFKNDPYMIELDDTYRTNVRTYQIEKNIKVYRKLHDTVLRYGSGDKEAAEYIVKSFHYYITMYVKLLKDRDAVRNNWKFKSKYDVVKRTNPSLLSFLKLFIDKSKTTSMTKKEVYVFTIQELVRKFHSYTYGDIYNELVVALLTMASRYARRNQNNVLQKENGTFHMYIQKAFHYEAYNVLHLLIKDPMVSKSDTLWIDKEELEFEDKVSYVYYDTVIDDVSRKDLLNQKEFIMLEPKNLSSHDDKCINFNWIQGTTCDTTFQSLTILERDILKLWLIDGLSNPEIAKRYHTTKVTIGKYKNKAIQKVQEIALKERLIKE